jgi:chlorobactene glucosyltransferase
MINYLTHDLILHLIIFQIINLVIIISNFTVIHRSRRHESLDRFPFVSILVPARNEEINIEKCVLSLLSQDYPNFEVLVLDDESTDQTRKILTELAKSDPKLKFLDGTSLNESELGKNWACTQLAQQAQGEVLVFTDADTVHSPQALKKIITIMAGENADMVTGYPRQIVCSLGEQLLVPFFSWAMYAFNPLILAYRLRIPILASAVGQLLVFSRSAYETIGGHAAVNQQIVDDLALTRRIIAAGLNWRVTYAADLITCRMYRTNRAAYNGFIKNLFAAFDFRLLPFIFVFVWLGVMFWIPLFVTLLWLAGVLPHANGSLLAICLVLSILVWLLPYHDLKYPLRLALIFPLTILANLIVASRSLQRCLSGRIEWKGRVITQTEWRWF